MGAEIAWMEMTGKVPTVSRNECRNGLKSRGYCPYAVGCCRAVSRANLWYFFRSSIDPGNSIDLTGSQVSKLTTPLSSAPSWVERGRLQADHGAAPHFRLEADFVDRLDHPNRVEWIRADYEQVRIARLDGAHDRREVDRRRRIALVVDDLESGILGVFTRAFAGILSEFRVRIGKR